MIIIKSTLLCAFATLGCWLPGPTEAQLWQMGSVPFYYQAPRADPTSTRLSPVLSTLRGEFRWAALIESRFLAKDEYGYDILDRFQCAATLIDSQWVLTSAICVRQKGVNAENVTIWLGRYDLSMAAENGTETQVVGKANIFIHPYYGSANPTYNFAMIKLNRAIPARMGATIWPIDLPDESFCSADYNSNTFPIDSCQTVATTIGWGHENGQKGGILQKTVVPTYYYGSCNVWRTARVFTEATICAGGQSYGDVCVGERGSALMCRDATYDQWFLLGVAQYGDPNCADRNTQNRLPAIYGRVCSALPFIRGILIANRPTTTAAPRRTSPQPPPRAPNMNPGGFMTGVEANLAYTTDEPF